MSNRIYTKKRPNLKEQTIEHLHHIPKYSLQYLLSLFPTAQWIGRYNLTWFTGDLVAGLTVGAVVIPQGLAYAKVAGLPPEYGLYSSFVGEFFYFLFATSKDMTIGPTAVMSLLLGQIFAELSELPGAHFTNIEMVSTLALFSGIIALALGVFRLGFIIDFIPSPVIAGFMTGSAITISISQLAKIFGIKNIKTTEAAHLILGKTLAALGKTKLDAAFGIPFLIYLYVVKYGSRYAGRRWPHRERLFFFVEILRNISAVIIGTFISYLINHGKEKPLISILTNIPSGINVGSPNTSLDILHALGSKIISVTFILVLEHVAIAKSFGRINDYKINASQELIAIGITNAIGSAFHAYPATGSFSRTAIKSKSGVRTPFAGVFSGVVVIIALYSTPAFYYMPDAVLAAVIIHAVLDLVSSPTYIKQLWKISLWETLVFVTGVVVTIFVSVEYGIYASFLLALVILALRFVHPTFDLLGKIPLKATNDDDVKHAYVSLDHPAFDSVTRPPDGILIFRFVGPLVFPSARYLDDKIVEYAQHHTKKFYVPGKKGDRPWNEVELDEAKEKTEDLPRLNAVIYDFSSVGIIDSTGVHALSDVRKALNKYSNHLVEYHFVNITSEDVEDCLIAAGFGTLEGGGFSDDHNEVSVIDDEESNVKGEATAEVNKKFFHLTIDEAIAAAIL